MDETDEKAAASKGRQIKKSPKLKKKATCIGAVCFVAIKVACQPAAMRCFCCPATKETFIGVPALKHKPFSFQSRVMLYVVLGRVKLSSSHQD